MYLIECCNQPISVIDGAILRVHFRRSLVSHLPYQNISTWVVKIIYCSPGLNLAVVLLHKSEWKDNNYDLVFLDSDDSESMSEFTGYFGYCR